MSRNAVNHDETCNTVLAGMLSELTHKKCRYDDEDARLISAAARRLRGTDNVIPALVRLLEEVEGENVITWGAVKEARAAIAKAEGRL